MLLRSRRHLQIGAEPVRNPTSGLEKNYFAFLSDVKNSGAKRLVRSSRKAFPPELACRYASMSASFRSGRLRRIRRISPATSAFRSELARASPETALPSRGRTSSKVLGPVKYDIFNDSPFG